MTLIYAYLLNSTIRFIYCRVKASDLILDKYMVKLIFSFCELVFNSSSHLLSDIAASRVLRGKKSKMVHLALQGRSWILVSVEFEI